MPSDVGTNAKSFVPSSPLLTTSTLDFVGCATAYYYWAPVSLYSNGVQFQTNMGLVDVKLC